MDYLSAIILAFVQGVTEWLPVSSSGHLVLFQHLLGVGPDVLLDTALHVATLIAVVIVYRKTLARMFVALVRWQTKSPDFKLIWWLLIATIPIGLAGLLFKNFIEAAFTSLLLVGITLLVTGALLHFTKYAKPARKLTLKSAFVIGLAQVIALLPGISRSGATIAAGLYQGVKREDAAAFSFLLFIPAVLGAGVLQAVKADWSAVAAGPLIVGVLVATIIGVLALRWLLRVIKEGKLHYFSWYCWAVGLAAILLALL